MAVLQIADQLLVRVNTLHEKSIIHRDIKPQNFVIGLGAKASEIYCVDFGLAKLYRDRKTLVHLPLRDGSLAGTPRYASISNHLGIAQSRRDDLESIAYMLIYFLKGKLPWQGLKASDKRTKYGLILECKQDTTIHTLCDGLPREFYEFLVSEAAAAATSSLFILHRFSLLPSCYCFPFTAILSYNAVRRGTQFRLYT